MSFKKENNRGCWSGGFFRALTAVTLSVLALAGCGGGGAGGYGGDGGGTTGPTAAKLSITLSKQQLKSGSSDTVDITVLAQDANNVAVKNLPMTVSASSGLLTVGSGTTGTTGTVLASLSGGPDLSNRTITITAKTSTLTATATVDVIGTTISVAGPSTVSTGAPVSLTVSVKDSSSQPVAGAVLVATSSLGNTMPTNVTTGANGQAVLTFTPTAPGVDTITVSSAGASTTQTITIGGTALTLSPATNEQSIGTTQVLNITFIDNGVAQAGKTVNLTTTRGLLNGSNGVVPVVTDGTGHATVNLTADDVGEAVITATSTTPSANATVTLEFVSLTPGNFSVQAVPSQIGTNAAGSSAQQATVTVTVTDTNPQNYPVKNALVTFRIKQDPSRGRLLSGSAITDSNGKASTIFVAGSVPSGVNEVQIEATVSGIPTSKVATLTVALTPVTISIGTGNEIFQDDPQTYRKDFVVLVSDSAQNAVADANVTVVLKPITYRKGGLAFSGTSWGYATVLECANEDLNNNGNIDAEEDVNGDGRLQPGKVPVASIGNSGKTDSNGKVTVSVRYPENYAPWAVYDIQVTTSVNGSEGRASFEFLLIGTAGDFTNQQVAPAGATSPYGVEVDTTPTTVFGRTMATGCATPG